MTTPDTPFKGTFRCKAPLESIRPGLSTGPNTPDALADSPQMPQSAPSRASEQSLRPPPGHLYTHRGLLAVEDGRPARHLPIVFPSTPARMFLRLLGRREKAPSEAGWRTAWCLPATPADMPEPRSTPFLLWRVARIVQHWAPSATSQWWHVFQQLAIFEDAIRTRLHGQSNTSHPNPTLTLYSLCRAAPRRACSHTNPPALLSGRARMKEFLRHLDACEFNEPQNPSL